MPRPIWLPIPLPKISCVIARMVVSAVMRIGRILVSSSWFVFRAVCAVREKQNSQAKRDLLVAIALGTVFVMVKIAGYVVDLSHFTIDSNVFFTYYFAITGIHCAHVIIGVVLLCVCLAKTAKPLKKKARRFIESCALFWHMVDLLWVIIFPMIYLMGGIA